MKKQLLLISSVALLASSCSNELLEETPSNSTPSNGITFSVVEDDATRGMVTNDYKSFFFAETDRISIYADKVKKGGTAVSNYSSPAEYKATKSAGSPWLAGVDDANTLSFDATLYTATTTPSFFVVYPKTASVTYNTGTNKFTITPGATLAAQKTTASTMNFDSRLLYQYIEQKPANSWNSVGESMNIHLSLKSPLSMLYFNVNDIANYSEFGELKSVTLDATGAYWMDGTTVNNVTASPLSYGTDGTFVAKKDNTIEYVKGSAAEGFQIVLDVNAAITNSTKVNMFVLPKNPVRSISSTNRTVTDKYKITYKFANVDLVYDKKESNGKWTANAAYGMPSADGLNIATTYPWILTRGIAPNNDRTLYVNSGNVKDIAKDASNIKWTDTRATSGAVPYTEVNKIVIAANVNDLTDADWAIIRKCTNATSLTINNKTATFKTIQQLTSMKEVIAPNVTTVEADAFKNLGGTITTLNLQSVTSYKDKTTFSALVDLNMASYPFSDVNEDIVNNFFNTNVKSTLVKCNIASVTALSPVFGYSRNILFTDYTALQEITLNATKTTIAASEFKGCAALKTVNGVLEMSTANNAFEGAGTAAGLTVNMFGTDIPEAAFKNSKVNVIRHNGAAIQPTTIGKEAFYANTKIESLDLSKTTSFGISAFDGATSFVGVTKTGTTLNNNGVVSLIATSIPANAFSGTAIVRFQLKNATTVYAGALASSALQQIKFRQNVSAWSSQSGTGIQTGIAGTRAGVTDLFVKSLSDLDAFSDPFGTRTVDDSDWE